MVNVLNVFLFYVRYISIRHKTFSKGIECTAGTMFLENYDLEKSRARVNRHLLNNNYRSHLLTSDEIVAKRVSILFFSQIRMFASRHKT